MLRKILIPFFPLLLLLISLYQFNAQPSTSYRLGGFSFPNVFAATQYTQDTTHLPPVQLILDNPSVDTATQHYLVKGIHFMYKFYIKKFNYAFPKDFTVKIRVFDDMDAYKAYTSRVAAGPISSHIGLYIHRLQEIVVWQGPDTVRFQKTVFHETSHLLLRSQTHFCPRWLNEGLSEYFEELDVTGEVPVVHAQPVKDSRMKKRLPEGGIPSLENYLSQSNRQWSHDDDHSDEPRTIAWSLVYYLMESSKGQQVVKDMLDYYRRQPIDPSESIRVVNTFAALDSFATPQSQTAVSFECHWQRWVEQERTEQAVRAQPLPESHFTQFRKWLAVEWDY